MKTVSQSFIVSTGLAIFSMLFGAGNLMYPIAVGMQSGSQVILGLTGFCLTAVLLPLAGLIGMILFNGDINAFFNRLGSSAGQFLLFACMLVVGPLIAIPRIVTLSHTMISPFLPFSFLHEPGIISTSFFTLLFLGITFLATYRENKIMNILGYVISPALLVSLAIIIVKGIFSADSLISNAHPACDVLKDTLIAGYETLDLLGTIFFSSIILTILKKSMGEKIEKKMLALVSFKAGLIGVSLLGLVYVGLGIVGAYHGHAFVCSSSPDTLFKDISFAIMGSYGAALIGTAVLMACLSTSIALSAVVAEYTQKTLFKRKISFLTALSLVLASCVPLSIAGLKYVRTITAGPLLYIGYPVLIVLTFCNIAYKLWDFKPVKAPVLFTFLITLACYFNIFSYFAN